MSLQVADGYKRSLKGGEKFAARTPVTYYVGNIPRGSTGLRLLFADVAPIPLTPSEFK